MVTPRWLNEPEARAWRGFLRMHQMLGAQIERDLLKDSRLSMSDYVVLVYLSEDENHQVRLTELADRMMWSKSRLSHQVTRMETRGLVKRAQCDTDARGLWIRVTDAGMDAIKEAAPGHVGSVRQHLIDLLAPDQIDQLGDICETVLAHLRAVEKDRDE